MSKLPDERLNPRADKDARVNSIRDSNSKTKEVRKMIGFE